MFKSGAIFTLMATLLINVAGVSTAHGANEVSRLVPFQGRLHGTDNKAVADGVYDITFNIYDTPTGGTPSWTEAHGKVSVIHGYVNVLLGAIVPMHDANYANVTATPAYDNSKNLVDFTTKKYLGISINGGVEMFPRSQLVPSFHAYTANHADHATQADNADNLGGKAASTYAQLSYVNAADGVLNQRITDEVAAIDGNTASLVTRATNLEAKFTGAKAKDADKLDNQSIEYFATDARMDAVEAKFTGDKAKNAETLDGFDSSRFYNLVSTGSSGADPNTTTTANILSNHANSPGQGRYWHIQTSFWSGVGQNAAQRAVSYNGSGTMSYVRHKYSDTWTAWKRTDTNSTPIGTVLIWPVGAVPAGYLECKGGTASRSTYPELYSVLTNTYGAASSTHFYLPDYRGVFLRGWAHGSSAQDPDYNRGIGSYQGDSFKSHVHGYTGVQGNARPDGSGDSTTVGNSVSYPRQTELDYEGGTETRPKNRAVMYIIKAQNL